jgi:hypothetical protein
MKTVQVILLWANKIWPWIVIPILVAGAIAVGLIWGEAKKAVRS